LKRILTFQFLIFFNLSFAQIGELGPILDQFPHLIARDSLSFIISEGRSSPSFDSLEGGAIEIEGDFVTGAEFVLFNESGTQKKVQGKIFRNELLGTTIATFRTLENEFIDQFSFKIISTELIEVKSVIGFLPDSEIRIGAPKSLIPIVGDVPKPTVVSREEWGAQPSKYTYSNHPYIDKLTLHHAACCSANNLEEGKSQVLWIQDFHQNGRGWNDIGYHFLVDRAGNIYQGRPETVIGAHVGGANTGNIGVCLLGCYHPPETNCFEFMSDESKDAIVRLFGWLSDAYEQNPSILLGHRDYFGTTACPGDNVWYRLPLLRIDITDYITSMELPPIYLSQPAYPNPFSNQTTLSFELTEKEDVIIEIYDLLGRKVNSIGATEIEPGITNFIWNGTNKSGKKLGNGMYFALPVNHPELELIKLVMVK